MASVLDYGISKDLGDEVVYVPVKASETWEAGSFVDLDASGDLQACDAGDVPYGITVARLLTADSPATDGAVDAGVFVGGNNIYAFPPDAGTVTRALVGKKMDVGGAQSVDIDASTDGALLCVDVDTDKNLVFVQLVPSAAAGV